MNVFDSVKKHIPKLFANAVRLRAFIRVLLIPFQYIADLFGVYVLGIRKKLRYDGRILYLVYALNDEFDPLLRRIYIDDATLSNRISIAIAVTTKAIRLKISRIFSMCFRPSKDNFF